MSFGLGSTRQNGSLVQHALGLRTTKFTRAHGGQVSRCWHHGQWIGRRVLVHACAPHLLSRSQCVSAHAFARNNAHDHDPQSTSVARWHAHGRCHVCARLSLWHPGLTRSLQRQLARMLATLPAPHESQQNCLALPHTCLCECRSWEGPLSVVSFATVRPTARIIGCRQSNYIGACTETTNIKSRS